MQAAEVDSAGERAYAPLPEEGRVYRDRQLVGPGDATADGRAHLDAIVRWVQDVAYADVADIGLSEAGAWVVRRSDFLVRRVPQFGERLELATFCSAVGASIAERRTSVSGNHGAEVEAAVMWVYIDAEERTPTSFSDEFVSIYAPSADGRRARSRLRHPRPPAHATETDWHFGASEVDLADHVNNVAFVRTVADLLLGTSASDGMALEAEYRRPAPAGPARVLSQDDRIWVVDDERKPFASLRLQAAS
ncbi:MAG: acyl-ACP thioesterase domain-containing protein [Solirubrobacterales bacterium]